jgi:preprotein translocase subunit SecG
MAAAMEGCMSMEVGMSAMEVGVPAVEIRMTAMEVGVPAMEIRTNAMVFAAAVMVGANGSAVGGGSFGTVPAMRVMSTMGIVRFMAAAMMIAAAVVFMAVIVMIVLCQRCWCGHHQAKRSNRR